MRPTAEIALSALITGSIASVVSAATNAALAALEGKSAMRPVNATSHWLHGDSAAALAQVDAEHTAVGYATHHASAVFWAAPFEAWQSRFPDRSAGEILRDAAVMSTVAAVVDYGMTPQRLTPGWEHVLSKRSMVAAYAALAIGLALGSMASHRLRMR